MKAQYWRIRINPDFMKEDPQGSVREFYLIDSNDNDITLNATVTYVSSRSNELTWNNTGTHLRYTIDRDLGTYPWYSTYDYTVMKLNGIDNCIKFNFGVRVDIRELRINCVNVDKFILEASNDNNVWICATLYSLSTGANSIISIPISATMPKFSPAMFWAVVVKNIRPNVTSEMKIKNVILKDINGNKIAQTKWNSRVHDPAAAIRYSLAESFSQEGLLNSITNDNNTVSHKILDTYNDSVFYGYTLPNGFKCHPMVYWNNTNLRNDIDLAESSLVPDSVFIKFDNSVANLPKAVSLAYSNTLTVSDPQQTMYAYQPVLFRDIIFIDDFTPYMADGLTVSGITDGSLKINNVLFMPDDTPPVTTNSLDSGVYSLEQIMILQSNENGQLYYSIDGVQHTYTGPVSIFSSCTVQFWSVDTIGNIESKQTRTYVIDLNPLEVFPSPRPGTYRQTIIKFNTSKPATIKWSYRTSNSGNPYVVAEWSEWSDMVNNQFLLTQSIDIIYQATSDGVIYQPVAVSYYYDANAHTINIQPPPMAVTDKKKFTVTMENIYE